jgi:hypothetical protein
MSPAKIANRKIVVEAMVPAPVELVWQRTQDPALHVLWDIRFNTIRYLDDNDQRGFNLMDYRTRIGFGLEVAGFGHYLQSIPLSLSTFEFDSHDWKSLITLGRGIWLYKPHDHATYFKTVYDYQVRHGLAGRLVDYLFFRNFIRLATEWGFETLRLWSMGDDNAVKRRRSRMRFLAFYCKRMCGAGAKGGAARSWLGTGNTSESSFPEVQEPAAASAASGQTR